jgi:hypothetical protein
MSCYQGHRRSDAWPQMQHWAQQVNQQMNRNVRIGDAERDEAAQALGDHFSAGRLDREEYDERLEAVFAARVGSDLSAVFRDLPAPHPGQPRRPSRPAARHAPHFPFVPVMLILVGVIIFTGAWWVLWIGLGLWMLSHRFGRARHRTRSRSAAAGRY